MSGNSSWGWIRGYDKHHHPFTSSSIIFHKMCVAVANRQKKKTYDKRKNQKKRTRDRCTFGPRSLGSSSSTSHNSLSAPLRKSLFSLWIVPLQGNQKTLSEQDTLISHPRTSKEVIPLNTAGGYSRAAASHENAGCCIEVRRVSLPVGNCIFPALFDISHPFAVSEWEIKWIDSQ